MASLEGVLIDKLNLKSAKELGSSGGGCISNARRFATDIGDLFVKTYEKEKVRLMIFSVLHKMCPGVFQ